jgi:catechol 2,3-dioxygenase-like lactoylglutathione lyase family enzyme
VNRKRRGGDLDAVGAVAGRSRRHPNSFSGVRSSVLAMPDGLAHAVLPVADVERSVEFYETVLGLEPDGPTGGDGVRAGTDLYWMAVGEATRLGLAHDPAATPGPDRDLEAVLAAHANERRTPAAVLDVAHVAVSVSAAERDALVQRLHARGRRYVETPSDVYCLDPDGNLVAATTRR